MAERAFETSHHFSEYVVLPNIELFRKQSASLHAAFNAVMGLDSLVGFIFIDFRAEGKTSSKNDSLFRIELAELNESYALIRDAAKTYKHVELTRPTSITRAKQTAVGGRGWGVGSWGEGSYGGDEVMIENNEQEVFHCLSTVIDAHKFLLELMNQ